MNYFPFLWFPFLGISSYLIFFKCLDLKNISQFFLNDGMFEHFWIFPFYFFSEICYLLLNYIGEKRDEIFLKNISETMKLISLENTAVIIPCHKGYEEIKKNRLQLQMKFKENIFIADNNNNEGKNEEFETYCFQYGLHYLYYPIPNKTNAILQTTEYIKKTFPLIKKIVLLDDDTVIKDDFFIRDDLLMDPTTAGYTCCIGIHNIKEKNLLSKWIDFEYRSISYRNRTRNFHTLKFLHGIICIYKIDSLLQIFRWNQCNPGGLPFGEDAYAGLKAREIGYQLKQDHLNTVYTYCPNRFFHFQGGRTQGYGASSLFKQRVLRWYLSWPRRLGNEFALLFYYDCGSWFGNFLYRLDFIWYIWILGNACWWIFIIWNTDFYKLSSFLWFIYIHVAFIGMNGITSSIRKCCMNSKEREHIQWYVPLTFPIFMFSLLFFYAISFFISIFYYIPFFRIDYSSCYQYVE